MSPTPAIRIENLSFHYPCSDPILSNISLSIAQGECIAIIGPNGGGKSTLLKLLLGFLKPSSGRILFFGKEKNHSIGYVPQFLHIDKQFPITVEEVVLGGAAKNLDWLGRYPPEEKAAALEALNRVGLLQIQKQPFGTLSGGQAQRALLARALVSKPEILLLDEPTSSIDPRSERELLQLIYSLAGELTILMVSHDLESCVQKADRLLCVQSGAIISMRPKEVCEHFALGLYHVPLLQTESRHLAQNSIQIRRTT